jgi:hypothetical protein
MSEKLGDAILELKTDSKKFDKGIKRSEKGAKGLETQFKSTKLAALGVAAAVVGIGLAITKAFSFAESGAKINAQAVAFKNLAKTFSADGEKIIKSLQSVSKGAVDNATLIESANKALLLGIDPSKFVKLMEIARAASKATGETIGKSFGDIAVGIGRMQPLILDNLGIVIKQQAAFDKFAKKIGIAASKLSDTQKKTAFLNATLTAGEKIIVGVGNNAIDAADGFAQLKTQIKNATDEFKAGFAKGLSAETNKINTTLKITIGLTKDLISSLNIVANGFNEFFNFIVLNDLKGVLSAIKTASNSLDSTTTGGSRRISDAPSSRAKSNGRSKIGLGKVSGLGTGPLKKGKNIGINFKELADDSEVAFDRMTNAVQGWSSNFSSSMTDVLFGAEVTFGGIISSFAKMIAQMIIQMQVVEPLLESVFSFLNPGSPAIAAPGGGPARPLSFFSRLGFADGGIVPGPLGSAVPAIVHGGEEVLTPGQRGGGGNVEVNIIGAPEGARTEQSDDGQGGTRLDVILDEEMAKNARRGSKFMTQLQKNFKGINSNLIRR